MNFSDIFCVRPCQSKVGNCECLSRGSGSFAIGERAVENFLMFNASGDDQ